MTDDHVANTIQVYNTIAREYTKKNANFAPVKELEHFVSSLPDGGTILDAGCGPGRDCKYFTTRGFSVTGVDLSDELLKIAHEEAPSATLLKQDLRDLHFPEESFDGIWSCTSLLHLERSDVPKVLASLYKFLKPNGLLFVSVKEGSGTADVSEERSSNMPRHYTYFSIPELKNLLEQAGFTVESVYSWNEQDLHINGRDIVLISSFSRKK